MPRDNRGNPGRLWRPGLRGGLVVDTSRGKVRIRAWPKPRGKPKNPIVAANVEWFRGAKRALRQVDPEQLKLAMAMTKKTGLYPADLLMMGMAGNLGPFIRDDGHEYLKQRRNFNLLTFQGVILNFEAPRTISTGFTLLSWSLPVLDTADFWSVAEPTRITNTIGSPIIAWPFGAFFAEPGGNYTIRAVLRLNGTAFAHNGSAFSAPTNGTNISPGPMLLQPDDFLEVGININAAKTFPAGPANSFSLLLLDDESVP